MCNNVLAEPSFLVESGSSLPNGRPQINNFPNCNKGWPFVTSSCCPRWLFVSCFKLSQSLPRVFFFNKPVSVAEAATSILFSGVSRGIPQAAFSARTSFHNSSCQRLVSTNRTELQGQGTESIFRGSHRIRAVGTYMSLGSLGAGGNNSLQSWKMQTDHKTRPEERKVNT